MKFQPQQQVKTKKVFISQHAEKSPVIVRFPTIQDGMDFRMEKDDVLMLDDILTGLDEQGIETNRISVIGGVSATLSRGNYELLWNHLDSSGYDITTENYR
jgi:hypothetical protein